MYFRNRRQELIDKLQLALSAFVFDLIILVPIVLFN